MKRKIFDKLANASGVVGAGGIFGFIAFGLLGATQIAAPCGIAGVAALGVCLAAALAADGPGGIWASDEELSDLERWGDEADRMYYMGDDMSDEEWADFLDELAEEERWA